MIHTTMESQTPIMDETPRVGMYEEDLRRFNWNLLIMEVILFAIGIWNLRSATAVEDKSLGLYKAQGKENQKGTWCPKLHLSRGCEPLHERAQESLIS